MFGLVHTYGHFLILNDITVCNALRLLCISIVIFH